MTDCKTIRKAIEERDFTGWQGLPASCAASDLFDDLPADLSGRPVRHLGTAFEPAVFVLLKLPGYYRPMANFRDGQLILFDAMNPELAGGWSHLAPTLPEPAAQWDWVYGSVEMPGGEWVYPDRGLTAFLNRDRDRALHIALYHATTLKAYEERLRPSLQKKHR